jgi:origin recognition complex subunit 1
VEPRVLDAPLSWKQQFLNSIQALSLTDASAHVQVQGLSLPGREEERKRIIGFLRTAITGGMSSSDSVKSAIFIAGPPGTGKTASVRSIVTELRQEQAMGTIPEFNFIALNGIELRDPFDAYVKLWEALSGSEKDRRTPGVAAGLLEQYFTGSAQKGNPRKKGGAVTVLLLDEIDYLLTKKQTVLYNFFDWPLRASTEGAGSRLVVIGISNTINLPDRLQKSVESRMGSNRCIFQSYKVDDIVKILKTRLAERVRYSAGLNLRAKCQFVTTILISLLSLSL